MIVSVIVIVSVSVIVIGIVIMKVIVIVVVIVIVIVIVVVLRFYLVVERKGSFLHCIIFAKRAGSVPAQAMNDLVLTNIITKDIMEVNQFLTNHDPWQHEVRLKEHGTIYFFILESISTQRKTDDHSSIQSQTTIQLDRNKTQRCFSENFRTRKVNGVPNFQEDLSTIQRRVVSHLPRQARTDRDQQQHLER